MSEFEMQKPFPIEPASTRNLLAEDAAMFRSFITENIKALLDDGKMQSGADKIIPWLCFAEVLEAVDRCKAGHSLQEQIEALNRVVAQLAYAARKIINLQTSGLSRRDAKEAMGRQRELWIRLVGDALGEARES